MSVDQTFHTPSFGDEEFEIPTFSFAPTAGNRCGGQQGIFANQQSSYQRLSPLNHHPNFQQQHQQLFGVPQQSTHAMSNGHYSQQQQQQPSCPSPQQQQARGSPPQNMYQQQPADMMGQPHSMNMQMDSFENCPTYTNSGMPPPAPVTMAQSPMHLMQHQGLMGPPQQQPVFSTISQTQLSSQLGLQIRMGPSPHNQGPPSSGGSPPGSNNNSPARETSEDSDDSTPLAQLIGGMKRPSPEPLDVVVIAPKPTKKPKAQKKKKKRDPNEPQKPVSAYALFFRDTQAAIKGQNPNASFGEVSKIVASMWDSLEADTKTVYKKKTETAKKEYLKALAAYRATLVSKAAVDQSDAMYGTNQMGGSSSSPPSSSPVTSPTGMMQKRSPILTSVVDSMQPVTTMSCHPQMVTTNQQVWHMQSPQHMMNNNSPPHMIQANNMVNMQQQPMHSPPQQQHSPQQQMVMSRPPQQPVSTVPQQICHSASNSPTYVQTVSPFSRLQASAGGAHSNLGGAAEIMTPLQTCLRSGCSNPAVDSPDWDREYCSSECVVSHCRDVFTAWVASRQVNTPYSTVK